MAPNPQCAALAAAKEKKGYSYGQIASGIGASEQRVIDIVTGAAKPTEAEFNAIANVLGVSSSAVPHTGVHSTA
ncbi:hypothetical protein JR316_0011715 [Psilocybe cubensis]|uniref:Uncharacterized protein n=2 Tax=Psilocybe cubensis TaxID=181762 RepID=A0ACB8GKY3_PSICU|nr:hypothetical protein JR316_0011715 [Psilocybe cubensis]KAH9476144.1 hypothetical protein JR316_0011715 [Psilocybe cubensis]